LAEAFAKFMADGKKYNLEKNLPTSAEVVFSIASKREILLGICQNNVMHLKKV
jgi:hypothetical protein